MAGRAAKREGGALAALDEAGRGQRHVVGRLDRIPGAFDEGRAGVEGIIAEQRVDRLRRHVAAQAARRPGVGHRRAVRPLSIPSAPDGRQEVDIVGAVHALGGRRDHGSAGARIGPSPSVSTRARMYLGARRHLEARHDRARDQFHLPGMAGMQRRKDCLHACLFALAPET